MHYEMCIKSLMAQVQDLRTPNLELQRSQQELSQAVAAAAGISQSYGDRMAQILSTFAKLEAVVQACHRDSGVAASVADHLQLSNSNTAKRFSAVETLATRYATVASRIHAWDQWYTTPTEPVKLVPPLPSAPPPVPDHKAVAPTAPRGMPSASSGGGGVFSFSDHPSHDCIYHPYACEDSGWPHGGGSTTSTPITRNPLRGGGPPKSRRNLLSPSGGRCLSARSTPRSLPPRGPVRRKTPLRCRTSNPSRKIFSLPPGNLCTRLPILRTRAKFLQ